MATYVSNMVFPLHLANPIINELSKTHHCKLIGKSFWAIPMILCAEATANAENKQGKRRLTLDVVGSEITESRQQTIDQLPSNMTKRCKTLMRQLICFSDEKRGLGEVLATWGRVMKPSRAEWRAVSSGLVLFSIRSSFRQGLLKNLLGVFWNDREAGWWILQ